MTPAEVAEIAARYDTSMSRAMIRALRALGVAAPAAGGRTRAYDGMRWCFENHGSPMGRVR